MRFSMIPLSLVHRLILSMALGLGLTLVVFGTVVHWTIGDSADAAYRERVTLAATLANRVDDTLRHALTTLEREAASLKVELGRPLTEEQRRQIEDLPFRMGSPVTISLADAQGNIVWPDRAGPAVPNSECLGGPDTATVSATGKPAITESPSIKGSATIACLIVPLRDPGGQFAGTLNAEFDPSHPALSLLPSGEFGSATLVQLVDSEGRVLAGTAGYSEKLALAHHALLENLITNQTAGYRIHDAPPGAAFVSHVVAYAPVPLIPAWGVDLEQPKDIVLATPLLLQQRLAFFGLIAIVLAIVAAWIGARRLAGPLEHLTAVAERFAGGKLDGPVNMERADELGTLARAFETMRRQLQRSRTEIEAHNSELERRVEERTVEVEERNRQLARANAFATTVSSSLQREEILGRAMKEIHEVTGLEYGRIRLPAPIAGGVGDLTNDLADSPLVARVCHEACLCGRAALLGLPLVAPDIRSEWEAKECHAAGFKSAVAVPLTAGNQVTGVLFLASMAARAIEPREVDTLFAIGRQVGMALANAQLYEEVQKREQARVRLIEQIISAQEDERRRMARDLHDSTGQSLSAIIMGLQALEEITATEDRLAQRLARTRGLAEGALAELRELIVDLRPIVLDDLGLVPAIRSYAERHLGEHGVRVNLSATGLKERLPSQVETSLFRACQEAIANIAKHARARTVRIQILRSSDTVTALIEDDGVGFDPTADGPHYSGERLGLLGLRERIELLAGVLQIESSPGGGTRINISLPVSLPEEATLERAIS